MELSLFSCLECMYITGGWCTKCILLNFLMRSGTIIRSGGIGNHIFIVMFYALLVLTINIFFFRYSYLSSDGIYAQVEYRILHNVFCEVYDIQRKEFAFDEYIKTCYERYLLGLITISPLSMCLEYFRFECLQK